MSDAPSLVATYKKWANSEEVLELLESLQGDFPTASALQIAAYAMTFSQTQLLAYLVASAAQDEGDDAQEPWKL